MEDIGKDVDGGGYICIECLRIVYSVFTLRVVLAFALLFRMILTY